MGKVTGIGGIFFKSENPERLKKWYSDNLGLDTNDFGVSFEWLNKDGQERITQWTPFEASTESFKPSREPYMINYIVDDIEMTVAKLRENGVVILDDIEVFDYGKFVHILDIDGQKVELWEPAQ